MGDGRGDTTHTQHQYDMGEEREQSDRVASIEMGGDLTCCNRAQRSPPPSGGSPDSAAIELIDLSPCHRCIRYIGIPRYAAERSDKRAVRAYLFLYMSVDLWWPEPGPVSRRACGDATPPCGIRLWEGTSWSECQARRSTGSAIQAHG